MIEGVLDAVVDGFGYDAEGIGAEGAADGVAAEGQDEAGGFAPPDAQVENLVETAGGVSELALVDDEASVEFAGENFWDDLVEGDGDGLDGRRVDFEGEIGSGEGTGDGDFDAAEILGGEGLRGDNHGAVALADAAAATHERVVVLEVGVGVETDGGDVVEGFFAGALVEGFNVAESVGEAIARDADLVGGEAVEHEGVIGVGTVGDGNIDGAGWFSLVGAQEIPPGIRSLYRGRSGFQIRVGFVDRIEDFSGSLLRVAAEPGALDQDVTRHARGCNQQRQERYEKNND